MAPPIRLHDQCTLIWIEIPIPVAIANSDRLGGRTKQFETVADAIVFIRDGLNDRERGTILISTETGHSYGPDKWEELEKAQ